MPTDTQVAADANTYLLEQSFRYSYAAPARRLQHRLVVVPRAVHGNQCRFDHGLTVEGSAAHVSVTTDEFANHVVELRAPVVDEWIEFRAWSLIGRRGPGAITALSPAVVGDRRLYSATPLTRPDGPLADVARELSQSGLHGIELAERACAWAHESLTYEFGVTGVHTTAADAVAGGRGVCQDYAHIMLALCRAAGLPARYVSGHLVGEGGSHAWVEVVVTDTSEAATGRVVAAAFDPTHNRRADRGYLTVAVGRDYADVAPTSGSFVGEAPGVLSSEKRLTLVTPDGVR